MDKSLYINGDIKEFDKILISYIDYLKNKLIPKGNYGLIITGIRVFHLILAISVIIGWLIPPTYKTLTIIYIIGLSQAIFFYTILNNCYMSSIVNKFTDGNEEKLIPVSNNFLLGIWILLWFISLNGYLNPEYAAFNVIKNCINKL